MGRRLPDVKPAMQLNFSYELLLLLARRKKTAAISVANNNNSSPRRISIIIRIGGRYAVRMKFVYDDTKIRPGIKKAHFANGQLTDARRSELSLLYC